MKKTNKVVLIGSIILGLILTHIFLLAGTFQGDHIDSLTASQYGSFIGGYIGTILSFVSIVILYLTLSNQIEASEIEKFENKFFELIKLHRENMADVGIKERSGRKIFVSMLRELREIHIILRRHLNNSGKIISEDDFFNISYLIFFYGVGPNSSRILLDSLSSYDNVLIERIVKDFENNELQKKIREKRNFGYRPFGGHQSRLAHYYRHLYQSVMFVHEQKFSDIEKYKYIKILRAQLSTHEQALLFFNARSDIGTSWDKNELITQYRLIKNLPKNFINEKTEYNVKKIYPNLKFEWEE